MNAPHCRHAQTRRTHLVQFGVVHWQNVHDGSGFVLDDFPAFVHFGALVFQSLMKSAGVIWNIPATAATAQFVRGWEMPPPCPIETSIPQNGHGRTGVCGGTVLSVTTIDSGGGLVN
jgi:hypothetical protein